jgi:hypothetical protein
MSVLSTFLYCFVHFTFKCVNFNFSPKLKNIFQVLLIFFLGAQLALNADTKKGWVISFL